MSTPSEKQQKIMRWLLSNVNPELKEIHDALTGIMLRASLPTTTLEEATTPENLVQVLKEVRRVEECLIRIIKAYVPSWPAPKIPNSQDTQDLASFEKIFLKILPLVDASLSVSEEIVFVLNDNITKKELEPIPPADPNETATKRQVRFIDKTRRIRTNLKCMGLLLPPIDAILVAVQPLYSAPAWSTPPTLNFYLEVVQQTTILSKIPVYKKGHYLIGRLPVCDIIVDDATCSRQHAVIQFRPGDPDPLTGFRLDEAYIYDLGSASGTYVNGMALQSNSYYPLFPGDILQFGQFHSSFIIRNGKEPNLVLPIESVGKESASPSPPAQTSVPNSLPLNKNLPSNDSRGGFEGDDDEGDELGPLKETKSPSAILPTSDPSPTQTKPVHKNIEVKPVKSPEQESPSSKSISNINNLLAISSGSPKASPVVQRKNEGSNLQSLCDSKEESSASDQSTSPMDEIRKGATTQKLVDPSDASFDESDYKQKMMEAYEKQQQENADILRKRKEREAAGLPPVLEIPFVPERAPRSPKLVEKKKKKKWWGK